LNEYLATRGQNAPVHSYDEIVNSPVFAQIPPSIQQRFRQSGSANPQGPESDACKNDAASRAAFGEAVTKTMDEMKLTAFVYPTWSQVPRLISEPTRGGDGDNSQTFSPRSGFPAINVPMGFTRNNTLPIGMTIYGRAWDEATLIGLAYAFEQKTHHRHKPQ
jgi:Asp-tRNA(Asn)/Glu-tRNA(Gln) amidotransferase A subunit family amidase